MENFVTINDDLYFGTSGDRRSRGEDLQKPALRKAQIWDGSLFRKSQRKTCSQDGLQAYEAGKSLDDVGVLKNALFRSIGSSRLQP